MDDVIDYEALCSRLVVENERLRKVLVTPGGPMAWHIGERLAGLREFIEDNYLVLMFALFVASALIGGLYTVMQDRRSRRE